ncbi:21852_t:CDS:2, partial [Dentiscutata erythropus]
MRRVWDMCVESVKDIATATTSRAELSSKQKPSRYKNYGVPRQSPFIDTPPGVANIATATTSRAELSSKQKPSRYKSYGVPRQKGYVA